MDGFLNGYPNGYRFTFVTSQPSISKRIFETIRRKLGV